MTDFVKEFYDTFIEIGASKKTARHAAETIAQDNERFVLKDECIIAIRDDALCAWQRSVLRSSISDTETRAGWLRGFVRVILPHLGSRHRH